MLVNCRHETCRVRIAAGIPVDAFHNALSARAALENAGSIGRIVLKLSVVRDKQVHQRVTDLSESAVD